MTADLLILNAAACGVFAAVYHGVLIQPDKILSKPRQLLEGFVMWIGARFNYGTPYLVAQFLTKSLIDCAWCCAGQVALVHYLWLGGRDLFELCLYITLSIFVSTISFTVYNGEKK